MSSFSGEDLAQEALQSIAVDGVEGGGFSSVDVEHRDQVAGGVDDGDHDLAGRAGVAGDVAGEGVDVVGIDVNPSLVAQLEQRRCWFSEPGLPELLYSGLDSGRLRVTTDYDLVSGVDVVIIAVGTPVQDTELVDTYLRTACAELAPRLRKGIAA